MSESKKRSRGDSSDEERRDIKHRTEESYQHSSRDIDTSRQHLICAKETDFDLVTNSYSIHPTNHDVFILVYKLDVSLSQLHDGLPKGVLSKNFVSRSLRTKIMKYVIPQLLDASREGVSIIIDDNLSVIFSTVPLKTQGASGSRPDTSNFSHEFTFLNLSVKTQLTKQLVVNITIKYVKTIKSALLSKSSTILTSLMHHQLLLDMVRFGSVYFESQDLQHDMDDSRVDLLSTAIEGISLSGVKCTSKLGNIITVNCPFAYITRSHRLIDLLASFILCRPVRNIPLLCDSNTDSSPRMLEIQSIEGSEDWLESFYSMLRGFKCEPNFIDEGNIIRFELTKESASAAVMPNGSTVQQFYLTKYGWNITYPNLPCVKSKSSFYPLEICSILPNQKVPFFRLGSRARLHLEALNKLTPRDFKLRSNNARNKLAAMNKEIFINFGLRLSDNPIRSKGFKLEQPILQFLNKNVEPIQDRWESGIFCRAMHLVENWCIVNTVSIDLSREDKFFQDFTRYCQKFGFEIRKPLIICKSKHDLIDTEEGLNNMIVECQKSVSNDLRFIMFVIDSSSTKLNRLIHLTFDEHPKITATCLRVESILNQRQRISIFRTLVQKLNTRLGGTNVMYHPSTMAKIKVACGELMVIGLDVTHPDNEMSGVSIVGCAYTFRDDLFRHRSFVWPQKARVEIIERMDTLIKRILHEYHTENQKRLPKDIIIYRDGVSHEEFEKVKTIEVAKTKAALDEASRQTGLIAPALSYIIAQKRHKLRFFLEVRNQVSNPQSGTIVDRDITAEDGREFYLYSNTSPQATARPLHYHILINSLSFEQLQKLTYMLCFNFGRCSGTLSMPSCLKYAHNAAYDARNRIINNHKFNQDQFYSSKFFC